MKLHNNVANEATLSNVAETSEFRIRNSAKAFNILSSGLYANKIRAMIRELSCNAVDSHVAAGKHDTQFEIHLPSALEPWFSVRDFGTGLNHEQVTKIYTTYFESTKTESNDFIGALGLGSKSPFSYTENFSVTAIKDGKSRIYSAFINGSGVPSIALMAETESTEPNGVEVKFAVEDRYDFNKFESEAAIVFRPFKVRPKIVNRPDFKFSEHTISEKDIVPGLHVLSGGTWGKTRSYAVMGNIEYPIDVPNAETNLGELHELLHIGLLIEFENGELDFQASREGLSYIPQTIDAIKAKLEKIKDKLYSRIEEQFSGYTNMWELAIALRLKWAENKIWRTPIVDFIKNHNVPGLENSYGELRLKNSCGGDKAITPEGMEKVYNIKVSRYLCMDHRVEKVKEPYSISRTYNQGVGSSVGRYLPILLRQHTYFLINDIKVGPTPRIRSRWNGRFSGKGSYDLVVLSKADKAKEMNLDAFFKAILNPPKSQIERISSYPKDEKKETPKKPASILSLSLNNSYRLSMPEDREFVWSDVTNSSIDNSVVQYYMPISGHALISERWGGDAKSLLRAMRSTFYPNAKTLYGVRKADLATIKKLPNWVNVEDDLIKRTTEAVSDTAAISRLVSKHVAKTLDAGSYVGYNWMHITRILSNDESPYKKACKLLVGSSTDQESSTQIPDVDVTEIRRLCYSLKIDARDLEKQFERGKEQQLQLFEELTERYPAIKYITSIDKAVDYIAMVDEYHELKAAKAEVNTNQN